MLWLLSLCVAALACSASSYEQASVVGEVGGGSNVVTSCRPEDGEAAANGSSAASTCYRQEERKEQQLQEEGEHDERGSDLGEPQVMIGEHSSAVAQRIIDARKYMEDVVHADDSTKYPQDARYACRNRHGQCAFWAVIGECEANPGYMRMNCAPVCFSCEEHSKTRDLQQEIPAYDRGSDLGEPQIIAGDHSAAIAQRIIDARKYMQEQVKVDAKYDKVRDICLNKNENCALWATTGECTANPGFMLVSCGPVCFSCEMLDIDVRCPIDPDAIDALYPGDLEKMFQKIITDPVYDNYQPRALSRPDYAPGDTAEGDNDYIIGPWVVQFENAFTKAEADRMIELGGLEGYERSADVGEKQPDGTYSKSVNEGRTSTNAWCTGNCFEDPVAQRIMQRIEDITGIPEPNSENLQLLRYEEAQFYQKHHDYIPHQIDRPSGVRILTFFLYLNDVEEGGGTNFPLLGENFTVTPKLGRAILWPSVLNDAPNEKDLRTEHQALPVVHGIKYGANAWIHMRDYKTPNKNGC